MRLYEIDLTGRDAELVADRCWTAGAAGLWEVDAATLRAGVDDDGAVTFVTALTDLRPTDVTDRHAVELAGRWSTVVVAGRELELWVPPTVFGDGHHPSTASCLELLPSVVAPGSSVLDVGCGAGALSLAAAALGGEVTAIDLDPEAVAATAANAERNDVAVATSDRQLGDRAERFAVVLANMTSGSLLPLVPDLVRVCAPGGTMLLSGMLEDQWPPVRAAAGGQVGEVVVTEGWLTAVVDRSARQRPRRSSRSTTRAGRTRRSS